MSCVMCYVLCVMSCVMHYVLCVMCYATSLKRNHCVKVDGLIIVSFGHVLQNHIVIPEDVKDVGHPLKIHTDCRLEGDCLRWRGAHGLELLL